MNEQWRKIPGFPDEYEASSLGRIRRLGGVYKTTYRGQPVERTKPPRLFAMLGLSARGYARVNLCGKLQMAHRLIAAAFLPNPSNAPQINHKNGIKTDNRIENLEWVSNQDNRDHAVKERLHVYGEDHYAAKLSTEQVAEIRAHAKNRTLSQRKMAVKYGVRRSTVQRIVELKTRVLG